MSGTTHHINNQHNAYNDNIPGYTFILEKDSRLAPSSIWLI
uniref:Uncharacterized protein n=1 Tax=Arundo donax TaxID=35708 RepID=A0A0A9DK20_ARUDO